MFVFILFSLTNYCGENGIRTHETLLAFTHFPGVPLQPLEHLSLYLIALYFLFENLARCSPLICL